MPHIIVEYTDTLSIDVPKLLDGLHYNLAEQETIDIHAIKTRATPVQYSIVGDGKDRDKFVHITLKLLSGREEALRKKIGQDLFNVAQDIFPSGSDIALSVEVHEMDPATYIK